MRLIVRFLVTAQALCLLLAGCGSWPGPAASPSPSMSSAVREPTPRVSPGPSAVATSAPPDEPPSTPGDAVAIQPDTYASVATSNLRVRSKPGVSDASKKLEPFLQEGALLVVLDGPVHASGYDWYLVQPTNSEEAAPFGWVAAAGKDGEAWIKPHVVECPPLPIDLDELVTVTQLDQASYGITCFSGREITLRGRLGRPPADCGDPPWVFEPTWFSQCATNNAFLAPADDSNDPEPSLYPIFEPDVDLGLVPDPDSPPASWPLVEVTGVFDHPVARECRLRVNPDSSEVDTGPDEGLPDPAYTTYECRLQFVVTSMREVSG